MQKPSPSCSYYAAASLTDPGYVTAFHISRYYFASRLGKKIGSFQPSRTTSPLVRYPSLSPSSIDRVLLSATTATSHVQFEVRSHGMLNRGTATPYCYRIVEPQRPKRLFLLSPDDQLDPRRAGGWHPPSLF